MSGAGDDEFVGTVSWDPLADNPATGISLLFPDPAAVPDPITVEPSPTSSTETEFNNPLPALYLGNSAMNFQSDSTTLGENKVDSLFVSVTFIGDSAPALTDPSSFY